MALALSTELLGLVRSKFSTIPIPGAELTLDGSSLVAQGREDQEKLRSSMSEFLASLTYDKMIEGEASKSENLRTVLKNIPIPMGKCIVVG